MLSGGGVPGSVPAVTGEESSGPPCAVAGRRVGAGPAGVASPSSRCVHVNRPVPPAELPDESILRDVINGLRAL
ncbi:hypothetical protein SALBM217S_06180 [Streptomyces griseoloalbus]